MFKKLVRLLVKIDLKQKSISLHETNEFWIERTVDTWAEVFSLSALCQNQHHHILIELDSYFMMNLVSISFIKSLNISLCTWKKHQHIVFNFKNVSEISSAIYRIYHLQLHIMNQWNYFLEFIWFFVAIDHNTQDSQILLDRSVLKNFKINICNDIDSWEFEQKLQITEIFSYEFVKKMTSTACIFEVWTAYRFCLDDNESDFWNDNNNTSDDLTNMLKRLCAKYCDFFNTWNADWLASY